MESIINESGEWAREIGKVYQPDLVVFIAKSGFLFAKPIAQYFNCTMADIMVSRPASRTKDKLKRIIEFVPNCLILFILKMPFMYRFNDKKKERKIEITERYKKEKKNLHEKILIVDDSVDTGWTMQCVYQIVKETFPEAMIKTAAYTVIDYSTQRISVDYFKYRNTIVLTATSRKSNQYEMFLKQYEAWMAGKQ